MQETPVRSLGWEHSLEKGMGTYSGILAWRIPWTEEPRRLQCLGSKRVGCDWATNTHTYTLQGWGCHGSQRRCLPGPGHLCELTCWCRWGEVCIESWSHVWRARFPQPHLPGHGVLFHLWKMWKYKNKYKAQWKQALKKKENFQCNDKRRHKSAEG